MNARRHRLLAFLLLVALGFSQVAVAAYACPIVDGSTLWTDIGNAEPMADCDGMPAPSDGAPNACEAHCLVGTQTETDGPMPAPVAVAPPLVLCTVAMLPFAYGATLADADAPLPTPPPLLRFARLLI